MNILRLLRLSKKAAKTALLLILAMLTAISVWMVSKINLNNPSNTELPAHIEFHEKLDASLVLQGKFFYSGATAFAALTRNGLFEEVATAYPQLQLSFAPESIGTDRGIKDLISGKLAFAHSDRLPSETELAAAKERGFELEAIPVATDGVAVFVNPLTKVKSLTLEQLQAIYRQEIGNWQELGGGNQPIVPFKIDPTIDSFWLGSDSASRVEVVKNYTTAVSRVGLTSGGISYASAATVKKQKLVNFVAIAENKDTISIFPVKPDRSVNKIAFAQDFYPLTRKLYVIIPRDNSIREKVAVAYTNFLLSDFGKKIILDSGFTFSEEKVKNLQTQPTKSR